MVLAAIVALAACASFGTAGDAGPTAGNDGGTDQGPLPDAIGGGEAAADSAIAPRPPPPGAGPYMAAVFQDAPLAYFRFDEDAGSSTVLDDVSKETISAGEMAPIFGGAGLVDKGRGARFDGHQCIVLGDRFGFAGTAAFTVEVWVQRATLAFFGHIIGKQDRSASKAGYALISSPTDGYFLERFDSNQARKSPFTTLPSTDDEWHLAVTYDGALITFYRNGALVGSTADERGMRAHTAPAIIGAATTKGEIGFEGVIDDLAIFNRPLTASRIQAHFDAANR